MKKLLCLTLGLSFLTACSSFDPDLDSAAEKRAENIAQKRAELGCPLLDANASYRDCVVETYNRTHPRTFTTSTLPDGQPVVVIRSSGQEFVVPAEKRIVITKQEVIKEAVPAEQVSIEVQETNDSVVYSQQPQVQTNSEKVITTQTTKTTVHQPDRIIVTPVKEKTWWETYQTTKKPTQSRTIVCPCPDPNAPCPECVEK